MNNSVIIGSPPRDEYDNFKSKSFTLGQLENFSLVTVSPQGTLYSIHNGDLYQSPLNPLKLSGFISVSARLGNEFLKFKKNLYHPAGELYVMSINGEILKGPEPDNKLTKAKKIGTWSQFDAMFFDPAGALYAVSHDGELYKGEPPTGEDSSWMTSSTRIGQDWDICQSMCFSPDGKLWCIDKKNGFLYSGDPPAPGDSGSRYLERAQYLGSGYDDLIYFAFVQDNVIQEILSIEFLPDMRGNVSSVPVVLKEKIYDNRDGRRTLRSIFLIQKTITESSSFIQEPSGFTFGPDLTVQCAVPYFSVDSGNISLNMSSGHKWNFMKTNDQEVSFSSSKDVELEAGRAIRMSASVMKAEINVRYKAAARTLLGSEVEISGVWKGVSHHNLVITQEKYTP